MSDSAPPAVATLTQPALEAWGRAIGEGAGDGAVPLPLVIVLRGSLGTGKSVLARAVARGAGVTGPMPSPTYNLLFTYGAGPVTVHHLDLYRLEDPDDVWELGWQELGQGDELVLIEWPERAEALLPPDRWEVRLAFPDSDDAASTELRVVRVSTRGDVPTPPALEPGVGAGSGGGDGSGGARGGRG
jgi:tRNA threonylcarbamoyladenosine biosynthesis protein TsaE